MEEIVTACTGAEFSNGFSPATLTFNDTVARMRMLSSRLIENHQTIDTVYSRVSLGGLAKANSGLVQVLADQVEVLTGLCWAQITADCSGHTQLDIEQWQSIGQTPPDWLRRIFEGAILLTSLPDEASLGALTDNQQVLVVRAPELQLTSGVLPQAAALLPQGFTAEDVRIWWPWIMGGSTPVSLNATDHPWVFQEVTHKGLQVEEGG